MSGPLKEILPAVNEREMCSLFQIDQNAREDFNLTSDGEFNAIKSLVLGKVHRKFRRTQTPVMRPDALNML